ncbi:hypothetical protein ACFVZH_09330 [Streptomyces sp. NPDC059534]|uniref:hypothetical protein n=1 Tax=Streptomyces sp. NPDC059534 TaxID=3346859 RepID=UPI0036932CDC
MTETVTTPTPDPGAAAPPPGPCCSLDAACGDVCRKDPQGAGGPVLMPVPTVPRVTPGV